MFFIICLDIFISLVCFLQKKVRVGVRKIGAEKKKTVHPLFMVCVSNSMPKREVLVQFVVLSIYSSLGLLGYFLYRC